MASQISKVLSANDTGQTGGHQAGILVPRRPDILSFFPRLQPEVKNPRIPLTFEDQDGATWQFAFIYYNGKFFGGTRNEYRLTRMTPYIREAALVAGDEIFLENSGDGRRRIRFRRARAPNLSNGVLRLGDGWKVVAL